MTASQVIDITDKDVSTRIKILHLENYMRTLPPVEIEPVHYHAKGLYAREIFIPKGTLLTGKIHKSEHLNIISQGDISVVTEFGTKRIVAPFTMVSQPGTKRVGYANEDTVWTTIHATDEVEIEKLEAELVTDTYEEYEAVLTGGMKKQVGEG